MRLPILVLAHIATAHRLDLDLTGSPTSSIAATALQNSTAAAGTHGSDRGVLSRSDLGIPGKLMQRLAKILAASTVLGGPLRAVEAKAMPVAMVPLRFRRNALSGPGFRLNALEERLANEVEMRRDLREAARRGNEELVKEALLAAPGVDIIKAKDTRGFTALMKVAKHGDSSVVQAVLAAAGVDIKTEDGFGIVVQAEMGRDLREAARSGNEELVKEALLAGPKPSESRMTRPAPRATTPLEGHDGGLHLRYYIFDWDDNVVHMPSRIWMEAQKDSTPVPLSTAEYALRRHDADLNHKSDSFREFLDGTGDFEGDLRRAMKSSGWEGPAFQAFREALMGGRFFAVVTARGHSEDTMRQAIMGFIERILSPSEREMMLESLRQFDRAASDKVADTDLLRNYLASCRFIGVASPGFLERTGIAVGAVAEGKKLAIRQFVDRIVQTSEEVFVQRGKEVASIAFGMSDDDHGNVQAADALMREELSPLYEHVKFVVFDTGDRTVRRLKSHLSNPEKYVKPGFVSDM